MDATVTPAPRKGHWGFRSRFVAALFALAALLVVAAAHSATAGAPLAQASTPPAGQWYLVPPVTGVILHDVDMVSAGQGWAVGDAGTLLRYDAAAWTPFQISTTDDLIDIFMLDADNGYLLGRGVNGGEVFHYYGGNWNLEYEAPSELTRLHASSASNVWAVGLNMTAHWTGSQWAVVPIPVQRQLFGVWAISDEEAWAVGQYEPVSSSGLILHYTSGQWVQVPSPSPQTLFDVFFLSPTDGWATGYAVDIYRFNGVQWSFAYTNTLLLNRLYLLSASEGWGISEPNNAIAYYDGTGFTEVTNPGPLGTYPVGIDMVSRTDGWIVGGAGLMLHYVDSSTPTPSATPTATATPCTLVFTDVNPPDYFYEAVMYLACHGVISGYSDGTFRPFNYTTRGQLSKIVVLAEGWPVATPTGTPTFRDVPLENAFYGYIETAYSRGVISGYSCGTACLEFRWANNITRGQLTKVIVLAENWAVTPPSTPTFVDVPLDHPFFGYIETAFAHQVISGYSCGTGCLEFRPYNNATRGQIAKIVHNAITAP